MTVPNDTTKFSTAFLIIWIIVTAVLVVVASLRVLKLPRVLPDSLKLVVVLLQLCAFGLFLAAMADDTWTTFPGNGALGVTGVHKADAPRDKYKTYSSCSDGSPTDDQKNMCNTVTVGGAFILIFGVPACFVGLLLTIGQLANAAGKSIALPISNSVLANVQWILILACTLIWSVCPHTVYREAAYLLSLSASDFKLGTSWILCIVANVVAIVVALGVDSEPSESGSGNSAAAAAQPKSTPQAHKYESPASPNSIDIQITNQGN